MTVDRFDSSRGATILKLEQLSATIPLRFMQQDRDKIERILVRGTNWIGDAVMGTPALQRLRSSFPQAYITLLASGRTTALFEDSPLCDEVIEYRRREDGPTALIKTVKMMRERGFDLAVLFQNAFEAALVSFLGGARLRIGFAEQGRGFLLTHRLHRGLEHRNRHQVYDYLDIVAECERVCLGSDFKSNNSNPLPSLIANARQKDAAMALLQSFGIKTSSRSLIAINAGATNSRAKCWPAREIRRARRPARQRDKCADRADRGRFRIGICRWNHLADGDKWRGRSHG